MPPQLSDNDASDAEQSVISQEAVPIRETNTTKKVGLKDVIEETQEALRVESDKEDSNEEEEESEIGEDEFVVEAIKDHLVDEESGEILYLIKWEGYSKKSEQTWEPEANLATAPKILSDYLAKVGGKDLLIEQFEEKKASSSKSKKRGRSGTGVAVNGTSAKRGKKNGSHPGSSTPPAGASGADFKPPTGSWEEEVVLIDACEGNAGNVVVYLTWKGGHKTQHPLAQVYKRCPQKMLKFYESHLVFKKNDDTG